MHIANYIRRGGVGQLCYNGGMSVIWTILHLITVVVLLLVMAVRPVRPRLSRFELRRRASGGDDVAAERLRRELLLDDILSLQRVVTALLLVLVSFLGVLAYHWAVGLVVALVLALEAGALAHLTWVRGVARRMYQRFERPLIDWIEQHPRLFTLIRGVAPPPSDIVLGSKEELLHLVKESQNIVTATQKRTITAMLTFDERPVSAVMTPRSMMATVSAQATLGPKMLDDLHRTGHSRFPVVEGDIDHIVGVLYTRRLAMSDRLPSMVRQAMDDQVYYIHQEAPLGRALTSFVRSQHHLFVVINDYHETVGVITLEDVVEALLGRQIVDEDDVVADLRRQAVANPHDNNRPPRGHVL